MNFINQLKNSQFEAEVDLHLQSVRKILNDKYALEEAKNLVPIAELVQNNLQILNGDYQDNLLPVLTNWYANEFFSWFRAPDCTLCSDNCLELVNCFVNQEGKQVEHYKCQNEACNYTYDFIRHNDPSILLNTRKGRCGEWANCFLLVLTAMDYEARLVHDSKDHVWNEVWSEAQKRWLHVDSCESAVDSPLLYEVGWSKKLEYCIAYGEYEVLDVTRRYSLAYNETKQLRKSCDESWLEQHLERLTANLVKLAPQDKQADIIRRRELDKIYLQSISSLPRLDEAQAGNFTSRKTGGIQWRIERGEFSPIIEKNVIIDLMQSVVNGNPLFELKYNCDLDTYQSTCETYNKKGWSSLIFRSENLDFKFERDWTTSYIARYEMCPPETNGMIEWRFAFGELNWSEINIELGGQTYPKTEIELALVAGDESIKLELNKLNKIPAESISRKHEQLALRAILSGGDPDDSVAWQKPQLFRHVRGKESSEWKFIFRII